MESFLQISNSFSNYWPKTENIQTNRESWNILIKVQCVIYQWIWLVELYKLMESFFLNFGIIFRINHIFYNNSCIGFMHSRWGGQNPFSTETRLSIYSSLIWCFKVFIHELCLNFITMDFSKFSLTFFSFYWEKEFEKTM